MVRRGSFGNRAGETIELFFPSMMQGLIIHIGLVTAVFTFSIPIFWGLVRKNLEFLQKEGPADEIKSTIGKVFAERFTYKINYLLFFPFSLLSIFTLFGIPLVTDVSPDRLNWLGFWFALALIIFAAIAVKIYHSFYRQTQKELNEIVVDISKLRSIKDIDVVKFVNSILRKTDSELSDLYEVDAATFMSALLVEMDKNLDMPADEDKNQGLVTNLGFCQELIDAIAYNISYRDINSLVRTDFFKKLLKLNYDLWGQSFRLLSQKKHTELWYTFSSLFESTDRLITIIFRESLKAGIGHAVIRDLENHVERYKDEQIEVKEKSRNYLDEFPFTELIFNNAKLLDKHSFWDSLPQKWKLTVGNLKESKKGEANIIIFILQQYVDWLLDKIRSGSSKFEDLEEVNYEWIPDVSPEAWSYVVNYKLRSWSGNRIESLITQGVKFGLIGRPFSTWGHHSDEEFAQMMRVDQEKQVEKTIELSQNINIFGFSEKELEGILDGATKYQPRNGEEESRKLYVLKLFGKFKEKYFSKTVQ